MKKKTVTERAGNWMGDLIKKSSCGVIELRRLDAVQSFNPTQIDFVFKTTWACLKEGKTFMELVGPCLNTWHFPAGKTPWLPSGGAVLIYFCSFLFISGSGLVGQRNGQLL